MFFAYSLPVANPYTVVVPLRQAGKNRMTPLEKIMITNEIIKELKNLKDEKYKAFQGKLLPTISPSSFIGVRTPDLRKLAKSYEKREDIGEFLNDLPHKYFDENQLHAFIISDIKDFDKCLKAVDAFLPFVDNWATCDQMSPGIFKKHRDKLLKSVKKWLKSGHEYTVRFAIKMLMDHYLDEDFDTAYTDMISGVKSDEYYVKMMIAWYFATALAKQYNAVLPYIKEQRLDDWTHNKSIQKALESNRINHERKEYLRRLKVK